MGKRRNDRRHAGQQPRRKLSRARKPTGGATIPVPATAYDPVPTAVVVETYADGSARAIGPRSAMSYRRMQDFVNHVFGDRAFKPSAQGSDWFVYIKSAPEEVEEVA